MNSVIQITGATGVFAIAVNGMYEPSGERSWDMPLYHKIGDSNWLLEYNPTMKWQVKSTEHRGAVTEEIHIAAQCDVPMTSFLSEGPLLPQECPAGQWQVWDDGELVSQSDVRVSVVTDEELDAYRLELETATQQQQIHSAAEPFHTSIAEDENINITSSAPSSSSSSVVNFSEPQTSTPQCNSTILSASSIAITPSSSSSSTPSTSTSALFGCDINATTNNGFNDALNTSSTPPPWHQEMSDHATGISIQPPQPPVASLPTASLPTTPLPVAVIPVPALAAEDTSNQPTHDHDRDRDHEINPEINPQHVDEPSTTTEPATATEPGTTTVPVTTTVPFTATAGTATVLGTTATSTSIINPPSSSKTNSSSNFPSSSSSSSSSSDNLLHHPWHHPYPSDISLDVYNDHDNDNYRMTSTATALASGKTYESSVVQEVDDDDMKQFLGWSTAVPPNLPVVVQLNANLTLI